MNFLIPKGWYGLTVVMSVFGGVVAQINFSDTVTLGSILTAALVVIAGGVATFRNNMRTFWRNLAEERQAQIKVLEERNSELNKQITALQEESRAELATAAEEQRSIRHDLKAQLAAAQQLLAVEHSKTDLSALMEQLADQHQEAMNGLRSGLEKQERIEALLRQALPADSISDDLRTQPRDTDTGGKSR